MQAGAWKHRPGTRPNTLTSITRLLSQLGLNRRKFSDPNGETNREPQRIIAKWPVHMVHIDVKKVGRIPDGGGWRAHGKASEHAKVVARTKTRGTKTGYACLHSAIDGYSRLAYTEALPDERAVTAVAFLDRARTWFAAHGTTNIERIVTDNGSCLRPTPSHKRWVRAAHRSASTTSWPHTASRHRRVRRRSAYSAVSGRFSAYSTGARAYAKASGGGQAQKRLRSP